MDQTDAADPAEPSPAPSPEPSPARVVREIELPGGRVLTIRPLRADDAPEVGALYEGLELEDRHRRFFSAHHPSAAELERWCTIGDRGGYAVAAVLRDDLGEHLVGEAGYVPVANGDGELALTVARRWRGWLGPLLFDLLLDEAGRRGIPNLEADILFDNRAMLALVRARGYATLDSTDVSVVHVVVATAAGRPPSWPPAEARPHLLVETSGARWPGTGAANAAGFAVATCGGPGGAPRCPLLDGSGPCPLVEGADAIVVALRPDDPRAEALAAAHEGSDAVPVVVQPPFDLPGAPGPVDGGPCRVSARTPAAEVVAALAARLSRPAPDDPSDHP